MFLGTVCLPSAATYYLDAASGDDGRDGASPSAPWKTLSKVAQASFQPGDSILLSAGQTFLGTLSPSSNHAGTGRYAESV